MGFIKAAMGLGVTLGLSFSVSAAAVARVCPAVPLVPPSAELRAFQSVPLGISLAIPSNYRSILRNNGHISFHDPASYELLQCLVRTGEYGQLPPHAVLEIYPGVAAKDGLIQAIRQKRPWVDYYNPDYMPIEIAGYPALQYEYLNEIYRLPIANLSFLAADGQTLVTLSGPSQHPIIQNALSTLEILPLVEGQTSGNRLSEPGMEDGARGLK